MNRLNELILQLHAEGEPAAAPAVESSAALATEPAVTGSTSEIKTEPTTRNGEKATFGLKIDKLTGRRSVVMIRDNDAEQKGEPAVKQTEPNAAEPAVTQAGGESTAASSKMNRRVRATPHSSN